jgi:tetratricopeptide (TPR) repeat protein
MNIIDKNNFNNLHNKANYLYKNEKYDEAIDIYLELVHNEYKINIIYSNISACYLKKKNYCSALYYSLTSLTYNVNNYIAWGRVGYSYKGLKKYKNALDAFNIAYTIYKNKIYKKEIDYFINKLDNKINKENIFNLLLNDKILFNEIKELKNDILNYNFNKITKLIETVLTKLIDK